MLSITPVIMPRDLSSVYAMGYTFLRVILTVLSSQQQQVSAFEIMVRAKQTNLSNGSPKQPKILLFNKAYSELSSDRSGGMHRGGEGRTPVTRPIPEVDDGHNSNGLSWRLKATI